MASIPIETKAKAIKRKKMFEKSGLVNVRIMRASKADRKIGFKFIVKGRKSKR